jgi:ABC-2 type transport system permease protein
MGPVFAIALKDIRLLLRDKAGLFFTFIFPILIGVFFGTIFAGGGDGPSKIGIAVVDQDGSDGSRLLIEDMKSGKSFDPLLVPDREEAVTMVRRGKKAAVVVIPKGYGDAGANLFGGQVASLELGTDPSRGAEGGMIRGLLMELAFKRFGDTFADPTKMRGMAKTARMQAQIMEAITPDSKRDLDSFYANLDTALASAEKLSANDDKKPAAPGEATKPAPAAAFGPMALKEIDIQPAERFGPKNSYSVTFAQAIMWGVVGCCSGFAVSLLAERSSGTLVRLRLSPLGWSRVLAGKALACFGTTMLVGALMVVFAVAVFRVRPVSWPLLMVAMVCVGACFVGIMMLLSVIGRKTGSGQIGWSIMLVLTMIGGGSIPLFVMPAWLQTASGISPVKWAILALEGGLWRGSSLAEMALPCGILLAVGVVGFVVGAKMFARDEGV